MAVPEKNLADHLFLLVGGNPLPNFVAAKVFKKANTHYYFVYSKEVKEIKDRLVNHLGLKPGENCTLIEVKSSVGLDIFKKVHNAVSKQAGKGLVMLNYTGGTKVMAVHAYRAAKEASLETVFSYLDATTLQMIIEQPGRQEQRYSIDVEPGLRELLAIHGYEYATIIKNGQVIIEKPNTEPVLLDKARAFLQAQTNAWATGLGNMLAAWNKWKSEVNKLDQLAQKEHRPFNRQVMLPSDPPLQALAQVWGDCPTLAELENRWGLGYKELWAWLNSGWLEHYTLACVQKAASQCDLHDVYQNIHARTVKIEDGIQPDIQLDVMAMKGHQLFVISCMAVHFNKSQLKEHLLEAYVRARQLGGEEARAALVCCVAPVLNINGKEYSGPRLIEMEIKEEWGTGDVVKVFGLEHLEELPKYLADWFDQR